MLVSNALEIELTIINIQFENFHCAVIVTNDQKYLIILNSLLVYVEARYLMIQCSAYNLILFIFLLICTLHLFYI